MNTLTPIHMEDYFAPGFKIGNAVIVGNQTHPIFLGNAEEQAWEGLLAAAATPGSITVVRSFPESYLSYWQKIMGESFFLNLTNDNQGNFLTDVLLKNTEALQKVKKHLHSSSQLLVFFQTSLEQWLADELGIPLYGSHSFSEQYGTKSGIRSLAADANIPMPPGQICTTYTEVEKAITVLSENFEQLIIKDDNSFSGFLSKTVKARNTNHLKEDLDFVSGEELIPENHFTNYKSKVVVEGWLQNSAIIGAHIEIPPDKDPVVCAAWQQVMDSDGITYIGAGPLRISDKALQSLLKELTKLAFAIKEKGGVGSFGPDFLITREGTVHFEPENAVLIELNARVPYTAFPLEIVKQIKGTVGSGFYSRHIKLTHDLSFQEIQNILETHDLLITKKNPQAKGVVPYHVGLLPWKLFDLVAIGNNWDEANTIMTKAVQALPTER